jgi:uncharacterized surface anchored protein
LRDGLYQLVEFAAEGYQINTDPIEFHIITNANGTRSVTDENGTVLPNTTLDEKPTPTLKVTNYQTDVQMTKVNAQGTGLPGAVFELQRYDDTLQTPAYVPIQTGITSGPGGVVSVNDLGPGNYQFVETTPPPAEANAPGGYYLNPTPVQFAISPFTDGPPPMLTVATQPVNYRGSAQFLKLEGDGDENPLVNRPLAGAVFSVLAFKSTGGSPVPLNALGNYAANAADVAYYTSDANGIVTINNLPPNDPNTFNTEYQLVEVTPPTGYTQDNAAKQFVMPLLTSDPDPSYETITGGTPSDLLKLDLTGDPNEAFLNYLGSAYFTKLGQTALSDDTSQVPVAGARYALYQMNDGVQGDQLTNADYGADPDGLFVSDMNGTVITTAKLPPGYYRFVEVQAPAGYILDPTPVPDPATDPLGFEVTDVASAPTIVEILIPGSPFINYTGAAQFNKADFRGNPLAGAVFNVVQTDTTPTRIVGKATSNGDGLVYAEGLGPGSYEFIETKTAGNAFVVNKTPIPFTIEAEGIGKPEILNALDLETPFLNYLGAARLHKTSEANGAVLAGAVFDLRDSRGGLIQSGLVTDGRGEISVTDLAPGSYTFVETQAPAGFELLTDPVSFLVPAEAQGKPAAVAVDVTNTPIRLIPPTGDAGMPGFLVGIFLAALCSVFILYRYRRMRNN